MRLVPVVDPNYFAFECQKIVVTSVFAYYKGDEKSPSGICEVDQETGQVVMPDNAERNEEFAKYVRAANLSNPQQRRLWLMQSIMTMGRVTQHPAAEAALEALFDPEATDDYLAGVQTVLENVYWEE